MVSDPLPALLVEKCIPGVQVWTKSNRVEFLRPARSELEILLQLSDEDLEEIHRGISTEGKAIYLAKFSFLDERGKEVARVENEAFIRVRGAIQNQKKLHSKTPS